MNVCKGRLSFLWLVRWIQTPKVDTDAKGGYRRQRWIQTPKVDTDAKISSIQTFHAVGIFALMEM